jgi:hypothetical protein
MIHHIRQLLLGHDTSFAFIIAAVLWRPLIAAEDTSLRIGIKYTGGDGSTVANAVIITGGNDTSMIEAEHAWLHQHVPGAKVARQSLLFEHGPLLDRVLDKIEVTLSDGSEKIYFFDISSGFGKLE